MTTSSASGQLRARLRHQDRQHDRNRELHAIERAEHEPSDPEAQLERDARGLELERRLDRRDAEQEPEPDERQCDGEELLGVRHRDGPDEGTSGPRRRWIER